MIRPTRAVVFGAAAVLFSLCVHVAASPHAAAQWLPDRSYTEGPGFRVGDLELHPGVAVRGGYDTNVFRTPGTAADPEVGSAILAVTPHLHLSTLSALRTTQGEDAAGVGQDPSRLPPPVAFDLGVAATYFHYFHEDAPKNLEVDFDSMLNVLPQRKVGFDVGAAYARNTRPFTARVPGLDNQSYAFDRIKPQVLLRGQSRAGVLQGSVGFAPIITIYESSTFDYLNLFQYDIPARLSWKFLPSSALLYDASLGLNHYQHDPVTDPSVNASVFVSDSQRVQSRFGFNGAVTNRIGVRALAGYGVVFLDRGELHDHEDGVGEAALIFAWSGKDNVELGYQRTLEISNLGGWTQLDRGFIKTGMLFANAFALHIEGGVAHVNYGRLLDQNGAPLGAGETTHREDLRYDAGVHGEYRVTNWLAFMADFSMLINQTDFEYKRGEGVPVFPGDFKTFQAFGGVRAHY